MSRNIIIVCVFFFCIGQGLADDKAGSGSSRADQLKKIQEEYNKARTELGNDIRAGKIKPAENGDYPGWMDTKKRYAKQARELIDADPSDAISLEAIIFSLRDVGAADFDPELFQLALKYHYGSEKVDPLIRLGSTPAEFLRGIIAKSPHADLRLWAKYHLAENLYADDRPKEAEPLLEELNRDEAAKKISGYHIDMLSDTATRLLFEIQHLSIGQQVPEIEGPDLDGKNMRLSDTRGKATLLVYWATWCGPCMAMVPHERALVEKYAGRAFAIVGVNGDFIPEENFKMTGADGKPIDDSAKVKSSVEKNGITWRSFRNGNYHVGVTWNVRSWPTIYLIDDQGVIRSKWKGDPGEKELDAAVEKVVKAAEAGGKSPIKR
jgi:thiol-disulfide isomerase/thioredoxin